VTAKRILVVEDDESIRESTKDLLEIEGYVVECVKNGDEGLRALRNTESLPDLILLDLMMPVMDGFQFRKVQRQDPNLAAIPVVVLTAAGSSDEKELGAQGYLRKPMEIDAVLEIVKQCCR